MGSILMGIDFLGVYQLEHKRYSYQRGTFRWNGWSTPKTTLKEVARLTDYFKLYCDPDYEGCISLIEKHQPNNAGQAGSICKADGFWDDYVETLRNPRNFVKTNGWKRAKAAFEAASPGWWERAFGNPDKEYEKNGEFWEAAKSWMIERSASSEVPTTTQLVQDSIYETIEERISDVKSVGKALNPMTYLPDMGPYAEVMKWATVAGGLFVLYKVVSPKKDKSR